MPVDACGCVGLRGRVFPCVGVCMYGFMWACVWTNEYVWACVNGCGCYMCVYMDVCGRVVKHAWLRVACVGELKGPAPLAARHENMTSSRVETQTETFPPPPCLLVAVSHNFHGFSATSG